MLEYLERGDYFGQANADFAAPFFTILTGINTLIFGYYLLRRKHYVNLAVCMIILFLLIYNYYQIYHVDEYIPEIPTQTAEQQAARKSKGLENAKDLAGKQFQGDDGSLIVFFEDGGFEYYPSEDDKAMPADRFYGDSVEIYYGQDAVEYYVYDSVWAGHAGHLTEEELLEKIAWREKQVSDYYCLVLNIEEMGLEDYEVVWFYGYNQDSGFSVYNNITLSHTEFTLEE